MTSEGASRTAAPRRGPVFGSRYAVATDHPLVSLAAMNVLQRGGNAVDAAIAAAFVNVVTKPDCVHLGGDAFSLIWRRRTNEVDCLNAGGRAPHGATLSLFADGIPSLGARASTVPGLVDALLELHVTYATLPLEALLAPAVHHAKEGFPVSQRLSRLMATLAEDASPQSAEARSVFLKVGAPYAPGETLRQPELAQTLRRIAEDEREGFYGGETAERIAREMAAAGGLIDKD
ncbi:MAG TPA: gamma-glutamyltransferase, partial [Dehalococcoidia bacterium]